MKGRHRNDEFEIPNVTPQRSCIMYGISLKIDFNDSPDTDKTFEMDINRDYGSIGFPYSDKRLIRWDMPKRGILRWPKQALQKVWKFVKP
jgi:hypothetical protein